MRNPVAKIGVAVALCALVAAVAMAQVQATRTTSYDWQCTDAAGVKISDHQREGTAIIACLNAPNGAYVQGGRYRITRSAPPPTPQPAAGSAALTWTPPTRNTDGTTLANLAGYRIHYGTSSTALTQTIQVADSGATSYAISNLPPGTWYFAIRAYTSSGTQSALSSVVNKVIL